MQRFLIFRSPNSVIKPLEDGLQNIMSWLMELINWTSKHIPENILFNYEKKTDWNGKFGLLVEEYLINWDEELQSHHDYKFFVFRVLRFVLLNETNQPHKPTLVC